MKKLKIGKIVNTHGIKGELKVISDSDFVEDRFAVGNTIILDKDLEVEVTSFRLHQENVLITINNLDDINLVEKYKNKDVYFDVSKIPARKEGFYLFQLEDLDVYLDNEKVGKIVEVSKPSQTVLRIQLEDREILLPYVDAFVEKVDLENNSIHINLIEGF
ncbi:MAG TPA: ribosome maturation factor RimM [Erysipelotrichaceae bacterium]|nr:ribosome maturation factor RimM [Erysipelotrichaceae bacterium]